MKDFLSDEVLVMFRPVETYRDMTTKVDDVGFWLLLRRPLFFLLILGATVSFTTSGQLIAPLFLGSAIVWSFAPVLQMLGVSGFVSVFARDRLNIFRAVDLFFAGLGPWLLWMLGVAGFCLLIPLKQVEFSPMRVEWVMIGQRAIALESSAFNLAQLAFVYAMAGKKDKAHDILNQVLVSRQTESFAADEIAAIYIAMGDFDEAFRWLEIGYQEHSGWPFFIKVEPRFEPLQSDPRYAPFMRRMRLEP